jgi:hypothetical protein
MNTLYINTSGQKLNFVTSKKMADALADILIDDSFCISWFDRDRNLESPAHVSECSGQCGKSGYIDYAVNRGAVLIIDVEDGRFVFYYRSANESASVFV